MSHIAVYQSSARMARQQRAAEMGQKEKEEEVAREEEEEAHPPQSTEGTSFEESIINANDLSQMSMLTLSDDSSQETSSRRQTTSSRITRGKIAAETRALPPPLKIMTNLSDVETNIDSKLHQAIVLNRIEERCNEINANFKTVMKHLQECAQQVFEASSNNLESLSENVELTCDKVDNELKAFHHLVTKCDELTTKLSAAVSFRDEIKTLRKSIETLEYLYKTKPQRAPATTMTKSAGSIASPSSSAGSPTY